MDEPTDPLARQLALSALTTEHFNLQTARMGTIAEANGRSTLYLGTLSSTVIAIAFIGQANRLGDTFYLFALTLLPPVFLLGVFTYLRLVQIAIEDLVLAVGSFRIREYFLRLDPAAVPFFPPTGPEGGQEAGAHRRGDQQPAADAADGREHGRLHQRDRGWGDGGPGGPVAAGRVGPGGGGDRWGVDAGVGGPVLGLPGPARPAGGGCGAGAVRGPKPGHAGMERARGQAGRVARLSTVPPRSRTGPSGRLVDAVQPAPADPKVGDDD
jgi:hypothetical protein